MVTFSMRKELIRLKYFILLEETNILDTAVGYTLLFQMSDAHFERTWFVTVLL